jgi:addiction module RelB/DinJ family antitoxin
MSQATVSFKTDSKIKKQYEAFAKSYGLTPSALFNIQMRQLIQDQTITI